MLIVFIQAVFDTDARAVEKLIFHQFGVAIVIHDPAGHSVAVGVHLHHLIEPAVGTVAVLCDNSKVLGPDGVGTVGRIVDTVRDCPHVSIDMFALKVVFCAIGDNRNSSLMAMATDEQQAGAQEDD